MSSNTVEPLIDLGHLPFHIGVTDVPSNSDFPGVLPFVVGIRPDIELLVQLPNVIVQQYLERVYRRGSVIGTPVSEEGFGRQYADDFLAFIVRVLHPGTVKGLRVLEIGCGSGYLLFRLKELGAEVLGIEPGEQGQTGAQKYGIKIVHDIFPSKRIFSEGRYDMILHHGVLEHMANPAYFLEMQFQCGLSSLGLIIFAVPDCSEYILKGDVSMFLHEHHSYFSPSSLKALLESVGLRLLHLEKSGFGGVLYALGGKRGESIPTERNAGEVKLFGLRVKKGIEHATAFFGKAARDQRSIGIFCAARIINLLNLIQPRELPRFFDDDPRLYGKYYPPIGVPVESRTSLLTNPVNELVIMSRSFGSKLRAELLQEGSLKATRIMLPDAILGH